MGIGMVRELIFIGRIIDVVRVLEIGLVNCVVFDD